MGRWERYARRHNDRNPFSRRPSSDGPGGPPRPRASSWLVIVLLALLGLLLFKGFFPATSTNSIPFSEFKSDVSAGKIAPNTTVTISDSSISGTVTTDSGTQNFTTPLSSNVQLDQTFTNFLDQNHVTYKFEPSRACGVRC